MLKLRRIIWKPNATWIDRAECRSLLDERGFNHSYRALPIGGVWRHTTVVIDRAPFRFAGERL